MAQGTRSTAYDTQSYQFIMVYNVVYARGDLLRPGSAEFRGSLLGFVVPWWKLAARAQLRTSLVDREVCRTVIAGSVEVVWRHAGGAFVELHPEEERCRRRWSKL